MKIQHIVLLTILILITTVFGETYTVQSGDTLSKIAQNQLNDSARWKEIAELNNLKEPDQLKIGQELQMPTDYQQSALAENGSVAISEENEDENVFKNLIFFLSLLSIPLIAIIGIWVIFSLLSCLLFAAGYKRACQIFKIETTFGKSFLAAICLTGIGSILSFVLPHTDAPYPPTSFFVIYAGIMLLAITICIIFLKFFFQCNWLQSLGIYIVGGLIGFLWHLVIVIVISVPFWIYFFTHRAQIT